MKKMDIISFLTDIGHDLTVLLKRLKKIDPKLKKRLIEINNEIEKIRCILLGYEKND